ncbi:hypothetical protein BD626DRAFT_472274 [Schizophyllum amplum]|uniref:BTB domain-containing protein n=1 Tax=Schizophyllum amplum TaxID=97359 RepID=A0A550CVV0_9AGAR|nr:hypothetical protein BD626DRAFT_472274 [Auriculariopsis ampla]
MTSLGRSASIQSFGSFDDMSLPTTSMPGSPVLLPNTNSKLEHPPSAALSPDDALTLPQASHRFYFEDGNVELETDDGTVYNVHRSLLKQYSPAFVSMYLQDALEGTIKLPGVDSVDFKRFLSMVYPPEVGARDITTVDEWSSILRLAKLWAIPKLCDLAIREIVSKASPIDTIVVAREFGFGRSWLLPAFTAVCTVPQWLEYEEAARLGLRTVVEIGRISKMYNNATADGVGYDVTAAILASDILLSTTVAGDAKEYAPMFTAQEPPSGPIATTEMTAHAAEASSAQPDQLEEVKEQVAHLTLRCAEMEEEARCCDTSVARALFARTLALRITGETSPAAQRHREWRQERVDRVARSMLPGFYVHHYHDDSGKATALQEIEAQVVEIIAWQLFHGAACLGYVSKVTFAYCEVGQWVVPELRRQGLSVTDEEVNQWGIASFCLSIAPERSSRDA